MDALQYVGSIGGIGGVFGLIMFLVYRQTIKQMREDRKYMEDHLTGVLNNYNASVNNNTKVLTELITWLRAKNGSK